jgi:Na+-transporting NADH:ubiquinone oxidoreductase subunit NqrB
VLRDARDYQLLFLSLFLMLGVLTRDWTLRSVVVLTAIGGCWLTQWLCTVALTSEWLPRSPQSSAPLDGSPTSPPPLPLPFNWRSPLITALGLSLLLRVDHWPTMALAAGVAITSKFLLRIEGKHYFNPANIGIIVALCLTHDAWVSPGQ